MIMRHVSPWLALFALFVPSAVLAQSEATEKAATPGVEGAAEAPRDGRLFDQGATMTKRAATAPEQLSKMAGFVGDWDLEMELRRPGQEPIHSKGVAKVTFMNRGHALMERTRIADFDGQGHAMTTMAFIAVTANGSWAVGEGNSWTEAITLSSGGFQGESKSLVLHDAIRPGGGSTLLLTRKTYRPVDGGYEMSLEISNDLGAGWNPVVIRSYQRRESAEGFFATHAGIGLPAKDRPDEASQFDFLLGEFTGTHWLKQGEQEIRWQDNSTAVHALDGYGILEFSWHNQDPSLPDAATSILRLYNRSMRHWESLFLTNRGNTPLHFGGVQEGDRIVLHPFDAQTGSNPLSQWIFFDPKKDTYRWKGLRSQDRGTSFVPYWTIDFERKKKTDS